MLRNITTGEVITLLDMDQLSLRHSLVIKRVGDGGGGIPVIKEMYIDDKDKDKDKEEGGGSYRGTGR